tara:strand:- start:171 stop:353 length:183 start_codon:yes stop_codon:yes gene_type:complete
MGEAKRRQKLGISPRVKVNKDSKLKENRINKVLNQYPYLPFIVGFVLLAILIIDLVNFYN